jgi:hypothetical protein
MEVYIMKTKEEILELFDMNLPDKVPRKPKSGTSQYIYVQITKSDRTWYAPGEVYKVANKLFWGFYTGGPHFAAHTAKGRQPSYGIA